MLCWNPWTEEEDEAFQSHFRSMRNFGRHVSRQWRSWAPKMRVMGKESPAMCYRPGHSLFTLIAISFHSTWPVVPGHLVSLSLPLIAYRLTFSFLACRFFSEIKIVTLWYRAIQTTLSKCWWIQEMTKLFKEIMIVHVRVIFAYSVKSGHFMCGRGSSRDSTEKFTSRQLLSLRRRCIVLRSAKLGGSLTLPKVTMKERSCSYDRSPEMSVRENIENSFRISDF